MDPIARNSDPSGAFFAFHNLIILLSRDLLFKICDLSQYTRLANVGAGLSMGVVARGTLRNRRVGLGHVTP